MKREPDYIIKLLEKAESNEDSTLEAKEYVGMTNERRKYVHHVRLMSDAGLVVEVAEGSSIFRITNSGHDLLEASRNPEIWEDVKSWLAQGIPLATAIARIASLL